jgi:hypothetical protein
MKIINKKYIFYFLLYFSGIIYWFFFFNNGYSSPGHSGWYKENVYLNILREAFNNYEIPFYYYPSMFDGNNRFLANPEIITLPHTFLLKYLSNSQFFFIHIISFYSIGYLGLYLIAKKLDYFSFLFLFIIFNFNGNIINRFDFGLIQYSTGIYLIPLFFYILSKFDNLNFKISIKYIKNYYFSKSFKYPISMSFLLSILFYNGSFHVALWLCLYLFFLIFFEKKLLIHVVTTFLLTFLFSSFKIIPAILFQNPMSGFITGYPSAIALLDGLLIQNPDGKYNLGTHGVWNSFEFSMYIGILTFVVFFLAFLNFNKFKTDITLFKTHFLYAALCIFILSWGSMFDLKFYISNIERITSRFIIIPFFVISLMGAFYLNYLSKNDTAKLTFVKVLFPFFLMDFLKNSKIIEIIKCKKCFIFDDSIPSKIISYEKNLVLNNINKLSEQELFFKLQKNILQYFDNKFLDNFLLELIFRFEINKFFIADYFYPKITFISFVISIVFVLIFLIKILKINKKN